ncbi:MAG: lysine--tRNA ligase [candidate division Zixibacteria bacterium]
MNEDINEILQNRRNNLDKLRELSINPFPYRYERTHSAEEILSDFDSLAEKEVSAAGRIMSRRGHGKTIFAHIQDKTGRIQIYVRRDDLGQEIFDQFSYYDLGDIIGVRGTVFKTRTGETTIRVSSFEMLSKSMMPLPEKWHGLQDKEIRYRRRYLDLMVNEEVAETFKKRSRIIKSIREFMDARDFLEVETPALQTIYGGANARPFITHLNALDLDMYLRIADELYLKRLIIGGMERVYEICKDFRNEGMDRNHNPEFTMLEFYWAYADYNDLMKLVEELICKVAFDVLGTNSFTAGDKKITLKSPFTRIPFFEAAREQLGQDIIDLSEDELKVLSREKGHNIDEFKGRGAVLDELSREYIEPTLVNPTFLTDYPIELSPLAKKHRDNSKITERFELFIGGVEFGNGFSELNDPDDQRERFTAQAAMRKAGDQEAHPIDEDFLLALEHGMPPTAGYGLGIDRFVMLLTNNSSIRDVILFPIMRPEKPLSDEG